MLRPLGKHIDALYLSVSGELRFSMVEILRDWKAQAAETDAGRLLLDDLHDPLIPGGAFTISAKGGRGYEFILRNRRFYVQLSTQKHLPGMQVQPLAELLYEYDLTGLEWIMDRLRMLLIPDARETLVSRLDVAVDFHAQESFKLPQMQDVITRARRRRTEWDRLDHQTLTLGNHGGAMQVQLYNKSAETAKGEKGWLRQVWAEHEGYDEERDVWRAEVRFKRELLANFGVRGIPELREVLGDMLAYAVDPAAPGSWVRIAGSTSRGKQADRRPACRWWEKVARYFLTGEVREGRRRLRPKGLDSISRSMDMVVAWTSKLAAQWRAGKLHDGHTGFGDHLFAAIGSHLQRKGRTWADAVNQKLDSLQDEDPAGGTLFELTPAMIRSDAARLAADRRRQQHEREELQAGDAAAWVQLVDRIKAERDADPVEQRRLRDVELVRALPQDEIELSGSTLELLRVRPSIRHEAGFWVSGSEIPHDRQVSHAGASSDGVV